MGVRDFRELVAWQLSYELKCEVVAFTAKAPPSKDFEYRDQIRASSSSAPANIAEGFFLETARASLVETLNHLIDGRDRGYLDPVLYSRLSNLARPALKATTNLMLSKRRAADHAERPRRTSTLSNRTKHPI